MLKTVYSAFEYFDCMKSDPNAPIGIFDSGIGGLTVVKAVREALPNEHIIYFGDTARVPYGIKSTKTVRDYALQITDFLLQRKVKMIIIACNTVSASAHEEIVAYAKKIPVLDVISAGTHAALQLSHPHNRIGVIGTLATITSGAYEEALKEQDQGIRVFSKACPLLVPLAEEGWTDNKIARETLHVYLEDIKDKELDSLILGCTHYPLFKEAIREEVNNPRMHIVDSAVSIARMARDVLAERELLRSEPDGDFECYVSDKPQRFQELAERFLGHKLNRVEVVSL